MIEGSRVRIPAGAAGEFYSPGQGQLSSVLTALISVSVPPPCYRDSSTSLKDPGHSAKEVQVTGYS